MAVYECRACEKAYDDPACVFDSGFKRLPHFEATKCPFDGPRPANWKTREAV